MEINDDACKVAFLATPAAARVVSRMRLADVETHLDGRVIAGAATRAFFRRSQGSFVSGHYLAAKVASPVVERCGSLMLRLRLMNLNAVRH